MSRPGAIWRRKGKRQAHSEPMSRVPYVILHMPLLNCGVEYGGKDDKPVSDDDAEDNVPFLEHEQRSADMRRRDLGHIQRRNGRERPNAYTCSPA